jgi:hypothetical protein
VKVHIEQANSVGYIMERLLTFTAPTAPAYIWHDLYLQVLFETDRAKLPTRIRKAERAARPSRARTLQPYTHSDAEREAVVTGFERPLYAQNMSPT